jgi:hypothetical protein
MPISCWYERASTTQDRPLRHSLDSEEAAGPIGTAADEGGKASPNRLTEVTKCRSCGDSDLREGGKTKN